MQKHPFEFGNPVRGAAFLGRKRELRRLVDAIAKGHSAALTAEPRLGKTSLLYRVQDPALYGEKATGLHFCYLDAQTLSGWDVQHFWASALQPVKDLVPVHDAYCSAALEGFGTFLLERFFLKMEDAGLRLVLLLDEFDLILDEPGLHKAEFYGGLRTLATRYTSLCLVLAARQSLDELNRRTQEYSRLGSPYFNFFAETCLSVFPEKEVATLLAQADGCFDRNDRIFLAHISGGYPYFLQSAAYYLWEAYRENERDSVKRRVWTGEQCLQQVIGVLKDTWRVWTPYQQIAFTLAALDMMPLLLEDRKFDINSLLKDCPNFTPEQRVLKQRGFLRENPELQGGYAPQAEIMVWFLIEELTHLLRPKDPDLASWLSAQEWDGLLKIGEKKALKNAIIAIKPLLKDGAITFIKAAAEGLGRGITGVK